MWLSGVDLLEALEEALPRPLFRFVRNLLLATFEFLFVCRSTPHRLSAVLGTAGPDRQELGNLEQRVRAVVVGLDEAHALLQIEVADLLGRQAIEVGCRLADV